MDHDNVMFYSASGTASEDFSELLMDYTSGELDFAGGPDYGFDFSSSNLGAGNGMQTQNFGVAGGNNISDTSLGLENQTTQPWTHVTATMGLSTALPSNNMSDTAGQQQNPRTPRQRRAVSSTSGKETFRDSSYFSAHKDSGHVEDSQSFFPPSSEKQSSQQFTVPLNSVVPMSRYPSTFSAASTGQELYSQSDYTQSNQQHPGMESLEQGHAFSCTECNTSFKTKSEFK
jgi:hypothetical protein